ncbi:MAG: hypothetical protein R8G33_07040 [Gammaproteobacteria bacterium]|nr:hypothetical protein [Gammaproteobacteria bacterium]
MKHITSLLISIGLVFMLINVSHASDRSYHSNSDRDILTTGEKMVLDAVVLRPIGLVTTVAGTAIYTISLPFSLLGGNEAQAREHLINEPARYTFKRPLGDVGN